MQLIGKTRLAIILCGALALGGCAERYYAANLTSSNKAQWDGFNQVMLLNVLRAKDREPLSYSHFTALRGSASLAPSVSLTVPFGPGAGANSVTPSFGASPAISDDVGPLDDQDFYRGILTPISDSTWALYQDQNWSSDLLFHVFVEDIKIDSTDYTTFNSNVKAACKANFDVNGNVIDSQIAWQCDAVAKRAAIEACKSTGPWRKKVGGRIVVILSNEPDDQCERAQFESFVFGLMVLGFHIDKDEASAVGPTIHAGTFQRHLDWPFKLKDSDISFKPVKDKKGRTVGYSVNEAGDYSAHLLNYPKPEEKTGKKHRHDQGLEASEMFGAEVMISPGSEVGSGARKTDQGTLKIHITTRSADGMIYYLGEVARASEAGKPATMIRSANREYPLLKIVRGGAADAAVCVQLGDERYSIARNDGAMTMETFELLKQVFALYNKGSSAPTTTAVTVVP